jgi:hypothetical protein
MNIEELLPLKEEYSHSYKKYVDIGQNFIKDKKIIFIGLARNIENFILPNIGRLINIGKKAKNYKIIIFENDSQDQTRSLIQDSSKKNDNIIGIFDTNNRPQFGTVKDTERVMALAEYRNKLKQYIKDKFSDYDFVIVTDMDFVDFSENGVYNSFGWINDFPDHVDAVAGNSFEYKYVTSPDQKSLWNYDSWAFRYNWWNELPGYDSVTYYPMFWFGFFILPVGLPVFKVNSAFGGMTIYKIKQFLQSNYDSYDCEHVCFHYNLKQNLPSFQLVINPSQIMLFS